MKIKGKKELASLQHRSHKVVWPNSDTETAFQQFTFELGNFVFLNLDTVMSADRSEARKTWEYDAYNAEFTFTLRTRLVVETKPGVSLVSRVEATFCLPVSAVKDDVVLAIELLNDDVREWVDGLREMRKLQLNRVLTNEGQEAYASAVERGM